MSEASCTLLVLSQRMEVSALGSLFDVQGGKCSTLFRTWPRLLLDLQIPTADVPLRIFRSDWLLVKYLSTIALV